VFCRDSETAEVMIVTLEPLPRRQMNVQYAAEKLAIIKTIYSDTVFTEIHRLN
jgi:hypothetical protein